MILATAMSSACDPYLRTTAIEVSDPTQLRYATADGRAVAGPNEPSTTVADHDVRVHGNRFAELIVTAHSASDGTLVTAWRTDPDLMQGGKKLGTGTGGKLVVADHVPIAEAHDSLSFPVCGRFDYLRSGRRGTGHAVTAVYVGTDCELPHDVELVASTPLGNVRDIRYESKNDLGRNLLLVLATSIVTGAAGTTLLLARDHEGHPLSPTLRGLGVGALGVGAAVDLAVLIPAIFARDHEETVYGHGV